MIYKPATLDTTTTFNNVLVMLKRVCVSPNFQTLFFFKRQIFIFIKHIKRVNSPRYGSKVHESWRIQGVL